MKQQSVKTVALVAALGYSAVSAQAQLNIHMGDNLTITDAAGDVGGSPIAPGLYDEGYVNGGTGGVVDTSEKVYAGAFNVTIVNNTKGGPAFNLLTFCTDVGVHWMANNQTSQAYKVFNFSGQMGLSPSWSAKPAAIQNAAWIYNTQFLPYAKTMSANQAAGIQLAIWAALYDTQSSNGKLDSMSVAVGGGGKFFESGFQAQTVTDANNILTALQGVAGTSVTAGYNEYWLAPTKTQANGDVVINAVSQGLIAPMPVPEPTTLIAGALLLLPFGASTLRFVRKKRAV
jgi:hypothetical protein